MTNLVISNHTISQDKNGFFSLTDLHKASGNERKHEPRDFLRNQETQELICEIELENKVAYHTIKGNRSDGAKSGTYACRELVYRYAMWISPKFSLMVIRAFDAMNTGAIPCLPKLSSDDTLPLRNAVNMATGVLKLDYATIYKMVHQRFGIDEIKDLPKDEVGQAVEYVHRLMAQATPSINIPLIQNILADADHQTKKARDEFDQIMIAVHHLLEHMQNLQIRLDIGERNIGALRTRFIA